MRLLATADLHYNHRRGRAAAEELIDQMNRAGGDVLLVAGDTASSEGDAIEACLSRFRFRGPRLFVPGNHELWTHDNDSYTLFRHVLPRRIRQLGWQWLQTDPFVASGTAIIGSVGWYDYSFAQPSLGIPRRFYAAKVSPGAAAHLPEHRALLEGPDDLPQTARGVVARWNDGRFVKLHRGDEQFLQELLEELETHLLAMHAARHVVAAIHHLPFAQLLPPPHNAQWDFAKAFLGSARIGDLLLRYNNVRHVLCGHSHYPIQATIEHIRAINIGSGYRAKRFLMLDIDD
ncbi:metallophosphoesterase [Fontivita pretiosa]|uniref:metallophosphoesterase n=1 Tax=Fontivita pretiosa TaxID=2989684 RepID=UPI003D166D33